MRGGMKLSLEQHRLGLPWWGSGLASSTRARIKRLNAANYAGSRCGAEEAEWLADQLGEGMPARGFEQILRDPEVEIVSIASSDDAHGEQVIAALEAGKHVFVEKPLCRSLTELKAIKQAWKQRRGTVKLSSNLVLRAAPAYQWLKQKLQAGELGAPYAFDGEYLYGRLKKSAGMAASRAELLGDARRRYSSGRSPAVDDR